MFNSYSYKGGNIQINAISGAILKNHPKSWFESFHLNSRRANELLVEGGHLGEKSYDYDKEKWSRTNAIIVLQMVICGDMEVIAECVYKEDLERAQADKGEPMGEIKE